MLPESQARVDALAKKDLEEMPLTELIETDEELEHFSEMLKQLDRLDRELTPEETALEALLLRLIRDFDDKIELST